MFFIQILNHILIKYLPLIVAILPLLATTTVGLNRKCRSWYWPTTWLSALAMLLGGYLVVLAYHGATWSSAFTWLHIPARPTSRCWVLSFRVDFATAVMASLTTTVHFITHLYALAHMQTAQKRYFVYTGCFVSAILGFFMAENLIARFIGWELIGWISYLLISFWYQKETATRSGTKAWLINQLGSATLLVGILITSSELNSFDSSALAVLSEDAHRSNGWLVVAQYCLVGGALSKSAQLPWSGWMSSAMTAPVPASALIHTAAIVGAGMYLLIDLAPVLGITTLTWVTYLGCLTAFIGAYAALLQQHIKQVLAYSTISQMGYTIMAVSIGASSIGLLHFVTHAFGKACLFLCVGNILHFLDQQQGETSTMKYMGGLYKKLPRTFGAYTIASFSLLGVPGLAGALSKDAVLACTWTWASRQAQDGSYLGYLVPVLSFCTTFLAVIYMGRQCYLVFMGAPRWAYKSSTRVSHRTPWLMQIGMLTLAICTPGFWYGSLDDIKNSWLLQRLELEHIPHLTTTLHITTSLQHRVTLASIVTISLGILCLIGWQRRSPTTLLVPHTRLPRYGEYWDILANATTQRALHVSRLVAWFDHLVINDWVRSVRVGYVTLGQLLGKLDNKLLGSIVLRIASVPRYLGQAHKTTQQGNLQHSLLWILVGAGLLLGGIYWATHH